MDQVIACLKNGYLIEAIKQFRALYGSGLKEAKEAVEAIRDAIGSKDVPGPYKEEAFVVISRTEDDYEWHMNRCYSRSAADETAADICANSSSGVNEVIVARITAASTRKLVMNTTL